MAKATEVSTKKADENISLDAQLALKRAELLEARKGLGVTLQNPHAIQKLKKDIARILTQTNATKGAK